MRFSNYNLVSQDATVFTASNIDANFPVSNLKNYLRSKRVRTATGTTTLTVVIDTITTEDVNCIVCLWPKEDGIKLTDAATVQIQANATNSWGAPAFNQTLTIDNNYSVASFFASGSTVYSYRYWRIVITDAGNPYNYIELGKLWLGNSLSVENAQNGFKWVDTDLTQTVENEFGHSYEDEYPVSSQLTLAYQYLTYTDIQTLQNAWRTNGKHIPVLCVLDPAEQVFDKDHFLIYGKMVPTFPLTHVNYNLLNIDGITIKELS